LSGVVVGPHTPQLGVFDFGVIETGVLMAS
jgi:hypothetical protein